jgi:hypothetical protein
MHDKYGLSYLSIDEIPTVDATSISANSDFQIFYDVSTGKYVKALAKGAAVSRFNVISAGASITLTTANFGDIIQFDGAAGSAVTLPAATGSGGVFHFTTNVLPSGNNTVDASANGGKFQGIIFVSDDTSDNAVAFRATAGVSNLITQNRSTTGGVTVGEYLTIIDLYTNRWQVMGFFTNSGTSASPFN